jgi:hypothetical protein
MSKWSLIALFTFPCIACAVTVEEPLQSADEYGADDSRVLAAVLNDTIRPLVVRRASARRGDPATIFVIDRSLPTCREKVAPYEMPWPFPCSKHDPMRSLRTLPSRAKYPGLTDSEHDELVASFKRR